MPLEFTNLVDSRKVKGPNRERDSEGDSNPIINPVRKQISRDRDFTGNTLKCPKMALLSIIQTGSKVIQHV